MTVDTNVEGLSKLRMHFPKDEISVFCKVAKKHMGNPKQNCKTCGGYHATPAFPLSYVGHAATRNRLLDADLEWSWEPMATTEQGLPQYDQLGGMWIKLTVCGVTRLGYGDAQGKTGPDAIKEVIGDAIRNAAMSFGVALELWAKSKLGNVDDDEEPDTPNKPAPKPDMQAVKPEPKPIDSEQFHGQKMAWAKWAMDQGSGGFEKLLLGFVARGLLITDDQTSELQEIIIELAANTPMIAEKV